MLSFAISHGRSLAGLYDLREKRLVGVGRLGVMDRFRGRYFLKFRISIDADSRASSKADGCLL